MQRLLGIELNPTTAAAARANIALFIARNRDDEAEFNVNILAADAIAPAFQTWDDNQMLWGDPMQMCGKDTSITNPYCSTQLNYALRSANCVLRPNLLAKAAKRKR